MKRPNHNYRRAFLYRQASVLKWNKRKMLRRLREAGIAEKVRKILEEIWAKTVKVSRHIYYVGKVIVYQFLRFLKKHPGLAAGIVVASGITMTVSRIPLIGHHIAPYVAVISFPVCGFIGFELDALERGRSKAKHFKRTLHDLINTIRKMIRAILPHGPNAPEVNEFLPVLA